MTKTVGVDRRFRQVVEPSDTELADILERAAEVIEQCGWCRYSYTNAGAVCYLGAIRRVVLPPVVDSYAMARFAAIHARLNHEFFHRPVSTWNDYEAKDASEVIDSMKSIAKDLRNRA